VQTRSFDQKETPSDQPPSRERGRDHVHIPLIGEEEDDTEDQFRGTKSETSERPASHRLVRRSSSNAPSKRRTPVRKAAAPKTSIRVFAETVS
jgi:hypothetical protein